MRKGRPTPVGELVGDFLRRPAIRRGLLAGRVLALWPRLVGNELARLTRAEGFHRGVLRVTVKDHVLAHQLTYQRTAILAKYAHELGEGVVREVRFRVGWVGRDQPQAARLPSPDPPAARTSAEEAWLVERVRPLPEELRRPVLQAGRALLRRLREAPRCPVCQGPAEQEGEPCPSCRHRIELPLVKFAASRIIEGEPVQLDGDLGAAARYRALSELGARLDRLAREAVADPDRIPELWELALRYLRLRTGREPRPSDLGKLPEPVRTLLTAHLDNRS